MPTNSSPYKLEQIKCPLCDFTSFDIVYKGIVTLNRAIGSNESFCPSAPKGKLINQVVQCKKCRFVYTNPRESNREILNKYNNYVDHRYLKEDNARQKNMGRVLKYIGEVSSPPGKWLDVGCSTGFFLREIEKAGWKAYGYEPSKWASDYARNELNLNVINGQVEDLKVFPDNFFDVVSLVLVFAHIVRPIQAISEIRRVLKKEGILFVQTPDFGSLMSCFMKDRWKTIKWQMLYFFTLDSLSGLLEGQGFKVISHRKKGLGKQYSLSFILYHLFEETKFSEKSGNYFFLNKLLNSKIYFNLYEHLNVIAVKNDAP